MRPISQCDNLLSDTVNSPNSIAKLNSTPIASNMEFTYSEPHSGIYLFQKIHDLL